MLTVLFSTLLSIILVILTIAVIGTSTPVHSVLYLILIYLISAIILFLIGYEFLAIIYIIVYIGAIMILFLFMIMMLNIRIVELRSSTYNYLPFNFLLLFILVFLIYILLIKISFTYNLFNVDLIYIDNFKSYVEWILYAEYKLTNIHYIGLFLYNKYSLLLILSGFLLFGATIGAILISFVLIKEINK